MNTLDDPTNVYQAKIKNLFSKKASNEIELLFKVAELMIFQELSSSDMFEVYTLLGMENFSKLVNLADGRPIRLPKKEQIEDAFLASIMYYEKIIKGKSWKEIKRLYPEIDISSIKYSLKITNFDNFLTQKIEEMLRSLDHGNKDNG